MTGVTGFKIVSDGWIMIVFIWLSRRPDQFITSFHHILINKKDKGSKPILVQ